MSPMQKLLVKLINESEEDAVSLQLSFKSGRMLAGAVKKNIIDDSLFELLAIGNEMDQNGKPLPEVMGIIIHFDAVELATIEVSADPSVLPKIAIPTSPIIPGLQ